MQNRVGYYLIHALAAHVRLANSYDKSTLLRKKGMSPWPQKVSVRNLIPGKPQVRTVYLVSFSNTTHGAVTAHNAAWPSRTARLLRSSQSTCGLTCHRAPVKVGAAPPIFTGADKRGPLRAALRGKSACGRKTPAIASYRVSQGGGCPSLRPHLLNLSLLWQTHKRGNPATLKI